MAVTWSELADIRRKGLRPDLPVYVTDRWILARNMRDVGCVAILHKSGERMPVELLTGLDVRLDFSDCGKAARVKRLMDLREARPQRLRAWCKCAGEFVAVCTDCDTGGEPWSN